MAQEGSEFELILVDDCSSQPGESIINGFRDLRIHFERNTHNLGIPASWNRCLEIARGEYVTIFHQDDIMLPGYLSLAAAVLDANPSVGLVYTNIQRIDAEGKVIGGHYLSQPDRDLVMPGWELYHMVAAIGNPIACQTVMARRSCYKQVGCFDERLKYATDSEMWMRIASEYDFAYISQPLVHLRVHADQETMHFANLGRDYEDTLQAYVITYSRKLSPQYEQFRVKTFRTLFYQSLGMGRWMMRKGEIQPAARYYWVSVIALLQSLHH